MARIAGVDLPKNKRSEIGLTYIYGIGRTTSQKILAKAGIDLNKKIGDLNDDEVSKIRTDHPGRVQNRRRDAKRNANEHQAPDGYRVVPRAAPSEGIAGAWAADADEFPYPERQAQDGCREEESVSEEIINLIQRIIFG